MLCISDVTSIRIAPRSMCSHITYSATERHERKRGTMSALQGSIGFGSAPVVLLWIKLRSVPLFC
eukprot:8033084-Pyramimonas_sp.AAC.1